MARPRAFTEPATEVIRVRVTRAQRRAIESVAAENNTSIAGVIRDAVDDYVADYRETGVFRGPKRGTQSHNRSIRPPESGHPRQATCASPDDKVM